MLEVRSISAGYGPLDVVHGASLQVRQGECVAVLGSAGAGKSTLLRAIAGLIRPKRGEVIYLGESLANVAVHQRVARGLTMVPEGRRLFGGMTVRENLLVGAFAGRGRRAIRDRLDRVLSIFPVLAARQLQVAGTLSGGEQQMCAIGRALMADPKLMLVDELSLGLAPLVTRALVAVLGEIRRAGTTIVLVEQDVRLALAMADRAYVVRQGAIVASGPAAALLADADLHREFLGS